MLAAGGLKIFQAFHHPKVGAPVENWNITILATIVSAIVSFIAVKWLLRYVQTPHVQPAFGWYRGRNWNLPPAAGALMCSVDPAIRRDPREVPILHSNHCFGFGMKIFCFTFRFVAFQSRIRSQNLWHRYFDALIAIGLHDFGKRIAILGLHNKIRLASQNLLHHQFGYLKSSSMPACDVDPVFVNELPEILQLLYHALVVVLPRSYQLL